MMIKNALSTHKDHEKILENILETHEKLNPLDHIKKFKIVKGDAIKEVPRYLDKNPHTIIS